MNVWMKSTRPNTHSQSNSFFYLGWTQYFKRSNFAKSIGVSDVVDGTIGLSLTAVVVSIRTVMAFREQRASEVGAAILLWGGKKTSIKCTAGEMVIETNLAIDIVISWKLAISNFIEEGTRKSNESYCWQNCTQKRSYTLPYKLHIKEESVGYLKM